MKCWYQMRAAAKKTAAAEILIYGEIGAWEIPASQFVKDLRELGEVTEITVRVNSLGGDVFDGLAIHNALKQHPARIIVYVDGIAASISSVIAMAGDEIIMPENAMLMIHDPSGGIYGTAEDLRRIAGALDRAKLSLVSAYRAQTELGDDEISALMSAETWFTAAEALEKGFCDRLEQPVKMAAYAGEFDPSKFRHAPATLVEALARADAAPPTHQDEDPAMSDPNPAGGVTPPVTPPAGDPPAPADAAAVAQACLDAGFADLVPGLLTARATMEAVTARIETAKEIKDICARARIPERAVEMIRNNATIEAARKAAFEAMTAREQQTEVDTVPPQAGAAPAKGGLDHAAVYRAFNTTVIKG